MEADTRLPAEELGRDRGSGGAGRPYIAIERWGLRQIAVP